MMVLLYIAVGSLIRNYWIMATSALLLGAAVSAATVYSNWNFWADMGFDPHARALESSLVRVSIALVVTHAVYGIAFLVRRYRSSGARSGALSPGVQKKS
ncbi:MAG: hypothetical protein ACTS10_10945 [Kiloniellales bacterium]